MVQCHTLLLSQGCSTATPLEHSIAQPAPLCPRVVWSGSHVLHEVLVGEGKVGGPTIRTHFAHGSFYGVC